MLGALSLLLLKEREREIEAIQDQKLRKSTVVTMTLSKSLFPPLESFSRGSCASSVLSVKRFLPFEGKNM